MPYAYSCERILATVDWAHASLREQGRSSGYAMDSLFGAYPKGTQRSGKFARYLRGENTPNEALLTKMMMSRSSHAVERMHLPLYEVLQRGHDALLDDDPDFNVLFDIERRLDFRLTRYWSETTIETIDITPPRALALAAYANSYALAALLVWAPSLQYWERIKVPKVSHSCLVIGQRAFQCFVLAMARGEFPQTGPVLGARIRQRVLDPLEWQGHKLDTASIDIAAAVAMGRRVLASARTEPTLGKRRNALRRMLNRNEAKYLEAITPKIVPAEQADAARRLHRTKLAFGQQPKGKANLVRDYGSRASRHLRMALGDYLSDG